MDLTSKNECVLMTKDKLENAIITANCMKDIERIADEIMAIPIPWFFVNLFNEIANQKYTDFKFYMAQKFGIPSTNFFICGSALLGYSLSPHKHYASFNETSDIDIVIISKELYDKYWKEYFDDYVNSRLSGENYSSTAKNVFKRFIDFHSKYSQNTTTYRKWEKKTSGYQKDLQIKFNFPEKISYRIYRSYSDYKLNLVKNIYDIKNPYCEEIKQ